MIKFMRNATFGMAIAMASLPMMAKAENTAETVVATVNGVDITIGHMIIARGKLPSQYQQYPDDILFPGLLDQLVRLELLKASFEGTPPAAVKYGVENEERSLLATVAIAKLMETSVTDEMIEAAYEEIYAGQDMGLEYNASHILVETEDEAKAILTELEAGADFSTAAQEHSTGPSGPSGGQLGWFERGAMVQPFDEAVAAMEVGTLAGPVQTQFGWHLIRLNETRQIEAPALAEVRGQIADELGQQAIEARVAELLETANIERMPTEGIDPSILRDQSLMEQ